MLSHVNEICARCLSMHAARRSLRVPWTPRSQQRKQCESSLTIAPVTDDGVQACKSASGFPEFKYESCPVTKKTGLFTACIGTAKIGGGGGGGGGGGAAPAAGGAAAAVAAAPEPEPEEEEEDMGFDLFVCPLPIYRPCLCCMTQISIAHRKRTCRLTGLDRRQQYMGGRQRRQIPARRWRRMAAIVCELVWRR